MRTALLTREVSSGLRRNVTMTVAMVLTTAISLLMVGTGLLAVKTIDATEALYSDRLEVRVALTQDVSTADADCTQPICAGLRSTLENSPLVDSVTYENQDQAYRDSVLPPSVRARVAIEQGGEIGWDRYVGIDGETVTMSTFGASAPIAKLQEKFGFTVDNVVKVAREVMEKLS